MSYKCECIIYKIENLVNGMIYVGQTIMGLQERKRQHLIKFTRGDYGKNALYVDMSKHGINNFRFSILQKCKPENLKSTEQKWIDKLDSYHNGYNMRFAGATTKKSIENASKYLGETIRGRSKEYLQNQKKMSELYKSSMKVAKARSSSSKKLVRSCLIRFP